MSELVGGVDDDLAVQRLGLVESLVESAHGAESITTSPNCAASRGVPVRAPISGGSRSSLSWSREKLSSSS
jgi:hypothetical protein